MSVRIEHKTLEDRLIAESKLEQSKRKRKPPLKWWVRHPQDNSNIETLLDHADAAMYRAKTSGKGRYYLFDNQ